MKKLVLMLGMACLFMVACNNAPKQEQPKEEPQQEAAVAEEHHCPFCSLKAEYANWEAMEEANRLFRLYFVGTGHKWGGCTVFWQIDFNGNVRGGKLMGYNRERTPHQGAE